MDVWCKGSTLDFDSSRDSSNLSTSASKKNLGGQQVGIIYLLLKAYLVVCLATFTGFAFLILLSTFNKWTLCISDWKKNIHLIFPCFLLSFIPVLGQMTLFKLVGKFKL